MKSENIFWRIFIQLLIILWKLLLMLLLIAARIVIMVLSIMNSKIEDYLRVPKKNL